MFIYDRIFQWIGSAATSAYLYLSAKLTDLSKRITQVADQIFSRLPFSPPQREIHAEKITVLPHEIHRVLQSLAAAETAADFAQKVKTVVKSSSDNPEELYESLETLLQRDANYINQSDRNSLEKIEENLAAWEIEANNPLYLFIRETRAALYAPSLETIARLPFSRICEFLTVKEILSLMRTSKAIQALSVRGLKEKIASEEIPMVKLGNLRSTEQALNVIEQYQIDFIDFYGWNVGDDDLMRLSKLTFSFKLSAFLRMITAVGRNYLTKLDSLESLTWSMDSPSDFVPLSSLTNLQSLEVHSRDINGANLLHLGGLTGLKELSLYDPTSGMASLLDSDLAHLSSLANLQKITLLQLDHLTGAGFAHLAKHTDLKKLSFSGPLTDEHLTNLRSLTNIKSLRMQNFSDCTGAGLVHLAKYTNLKKLALNGCDSLTDANVGHIRKFSNLEALQLEFCVNLTGAGLIHIGRLRNLRYLDLGSCHLLTDADLMNLSELRNLQSLRTWGCALVIGSGFEHLSGSQSLQELAIANSGVNSLAQIGTFTNLVYLDLKMSLSFTDSELSHISNLINLTVLNLRMCIQLTDSGLTYLGRLTKLETLDLGHIENLTYLGVSHLIDRLPSLKKIRVCHRVGEALKSANERNLVINS